MRMSVESPPGRQKKSSASDGSLFAPTPSSPPELQPRELFTALQKSKCPISSENATLYVCAAHGTRVSGLEVEYIGWKLYGMAVQPEPVGSNFTCAKLLAALATMKPFWPVVVSPISMRSPLGVSCILTEILSPPFIIRSLVGSGVNVVPVAL